jgi:hypothetical protein
MAFTVVEPCSGENSRVDTGGANFYRPPSGGGISSCLQIDRTSFQSISRCRGTADRGPVGAAQRV